MKTGSKVWKGKQGKLPGIANITTQIDFFAIFSTNAYEPNT